MLTFLVKTHFFSKKSFIESVQSQLAEIITIGIFLFSKNFKNSIIQSLNSIIQDEITFSISFLFNFDFMSNSLCLFRQFIISFFFSSIEILGFISMGL